MAHDIEQMLREIFGESYNRLTQFQSDQIRKATGKLHDIAREAVKEDLARLTAEVVDLHARIAKLETERAQQAAESLESSF